jgi:penicillin-binding protein 2
MESVIQRIAKIYKLLVVFLVFIFCISLRLFYLQVDQGNALALQGERNFIKTEIIPPLRGNLFDCNKRLLASNRPIYDIYWQGRGVFSLTNYHRNLLSQLETLLETSFLQDEKIKIISRTERYARRILLKDDISFYQLCKISEHFSHCQNLVIKNRFKRVYPYNTFASHIVGYLSRIGYVGCSGIEKLFQETLCGQGGYVKNIINSTGKLLSKKDYRDAQAGNDFVLTIDFNIQTLAESTFKKDQTGTMIVMNPETGAIKALASFPSFNPNLFLNPILNKTWKKSFTINSPLLNRATQSLYPPASIFKLITIAAGLEKGIISQDTSFNCKGYDTFYKRRYLCQRKWGHGNINLRDSLAFSCNIPCFKIARQISIDTLAEYAFRFGLGEKTNFLLPENSGLIPTSMWKISIKGEQWWTGETLSASIGQSYLLVTPLQLARMICVICSGYLVKPRILEQEPVEKKDVLISPETLDFLQKAMSQTVTKGTVKKLNYLKEFQVFAKTGTAQTCSLKKKKKEKEDYEHAWLAGFFNYKGSKPLVLVILVEHVGACLPAIQIADTFLRGYEKFQHMKNHKLILL